MVLPEKHSSLVFAVSLLSDIIHSILHLCYWLSHYCLTSYIPCITCVTRYHNATSHQPSLFQLQGDTHQYPVSSRFWTACALGASGLGTVCCPPFIIPWPCVLSSLLPDGQPTLWPSPWKTRICERNSLLYTNHNLQARPSRVLCECSPSS